MWKICTGKFREGKLRIYIPIDLETIYIFCVMEEEKSTAEMMILEAFANIICMIIKKIAKISPIMRLTGGNCKSKTDRRRLFRRKEVEE